ncbi:MAG: gamma-glutamyl-gamma-aminobutyrate hydrolase family protein [Bacteroidota bacterium]
MVIGITDTLNKKIDFYISWLRKVARDADIIKLSHEAKNAKDLKKCDGIILSGGGDIHPKFYGREDYMKLLNKEDVNEKRDEFEFKIVKDALKKGMPILGICRGMQVFNVALGGSMVPDLESEGHKNHAKTKEGKDRRHKVKIEKGTTLHWIVEATKGDVNTAHHQAVDVIADGLKVAAKSPDGIVEALEWEKSEGKEFLQLVQWHPERMEDFGNPCSRNLLEHFVLAAVSGAED